MGDVADDRSLSQRSLTVAERVQGFVEGTHADEYEAVQQAIDRFDPRRQGVMLIRLAAKLNNGDEHFDHGENGYSWLCLRCAQKDGMGPFFTTVEAMFGQSRTLAKTPDSGPQQSASEVRGESLTQWPDCSGEATAVGA